jgi:hypothetical protein
MRGFFVFIIPSVLSLENISCLPLVLLFSNPLRSKFIDHRQDSKWASAAGKPVWKLFCVPIKKKSFVAHCTINL